MTNPIINATTIIDAINVKLASILEASECAVFYKDKVPAGFTRPSIAILEIDLPDKDGLKTDDYMMQEKTWMFDLIFHPTRDYDIYKEWRNIEHKLNLNLDEIEIATGYTLLREPNPNAFVSNDIGHFIITFKSLCRVVNASSTTTIRDVTTKTKLK